MLFDFDFVMNMGNEMTWKKAMISLRCGRFELVMTAKRSSELREPCTLTDDQGLALKMATAVLVASS